MRRGEHGFTLIEIMVVIAIIAGLGAAVSLGIPVVQERSNRLTCQQNLSDLGKLFITWRQENPNKPPYSGAALFLYFRQKGEILKGDESKLICPGDQGVIRPDTPDQQDRYDDVDLQDIPDDMCSYAVRDFRNYPLLVDAKELQIIACDRNGVNGHTMQHKDGLVMLRDNGSAQYMDREKLGISGDAEIVVGPDSGHDKLKRVVHKADARKE